MVKLNINLGFGFCYVFVDDFADCFCGESICVLCHFVGLVLRVVSSIVD